MPDEQPAPPTPIGAGRRGRAKRLTGAAELFTVKDVGDACGLPQPVVAQLVPRTWTAEGWMYTAEQLQYAVQISQSVRDGRYAPPGGEEISARDTPQPGLVSMHEHRHRQQ